MTLSLSLTRTRRAAVQPRSFRSAPVHLAMLAWAVVTALPLLWAVVSSFKTDDEILNDPWSLPLPEKVSLPTR